MVSQVHAQSALAAGQAHSLAQGSHVAPAIIQTLRKTSERIPRAAALEWRSKYP
jgi:hypothetical protein